MKKVQMFMLYSVLTIGFADSLQASWFTGKPKVDPAKSGESKAGEPAKSGKIEPTAAEKQTINTQPTKAEVQDTINQQNQDATKRIQEQGENLQKAAEQLDTNVFRKSSKKSSQPSPQPSLSFLTWFKKGGEAKIQKTANNLEPQAQGVRSEINPEIKEEKLGVMVSVLGKDVQNGTGQKPNDDDNAQFTETAKSWSESDNPQAFTAWVSRCYERVVDKISAEPQNTATGSIKLDFQDSSAGEVDSSGNGADSSKNTINTSTKQLFNNIESAQQLDDQAGTVKTNAKTYADNASKANNPKLDTWGNALRGMVGLPLVAA